MKRNTSLPSWVTVFLVLFFSVLSGTSAVAQSNNAVVNSFVDGLRKEFMADKTMNVKSVEFKGKVLVVDSYGNGDSFDLYYEVLEATKKFMSDHKRELPAEYKEILNALEKEGISFRISISDASSGKRYDVDYTAQQFISSYMLDDMGDADKLTNELFAYIPFEKVVAIMNSATQNSGVSFSCENGRLYIVTEIPAGDYVPLKQIYDHNPHSFVEMMKDGMLQSMTADESTKVFIDLAHSNGYRLSVRFACQGYESISFDIE